MKKLTVRLLWAATALLLTGMAQSADAWWGISLSSYIVWRGGW